MKNFRSMLLKPSLEGEATGNTERELEYVFYGRIGNMAALEQAASKEVQDQWSIHGVDGQIRVRATDGTKFEMAIKTWQKGVQGKNETELEITQDMFEQFKGMAPQGMPKTRFVFPIEGTDYKWEVDVPMRADGTLSNYCKIDLEVKAELSELPAFPEALQLSEMILNQFGQRTEEEQATIDRIMKEHFVVNNPKTSAS